MIEYPAVNMKKRTGRKRDTSNKYDSHQVQQEHTQSIDKGDKHIQEIVARDILQKEREFGLSKVNPEDILNEEVKRTNPICLEE
jgi:hypothetical protein